MQTEILKEKLQQYSKDEIIEYTLKLIKEKKEVDDDLKQVGKSLVKILQNTGLMNDKLEVTDDLVSISGALLSLGTDLGFRKNKLKQKFSFVKEMIPLLQKYKNVLKD